MHCCFRCTRPWRLTMFALALVVAGQAVVLFAEPPSTSYIFPAGGQRGTTVSARVGGHYLHDRARWELLGPSMTAAPELVRTETVWFEGPLVRLPASQRAEDYPQDYEAMIKIAPDAPLGAHPWRVWNAQGATAARRFVVGDLPEIVEQEVDGDPLPVPVKLPVTINGRIFPREDVDVWSFEASAGRTMTCAVAAQSLGSPLEARLEVRDPSGRPIAEATGLAATDPVLQFTTTTAGVYQVLIHDVRYDGLQRYVYRLTLTEQPWVRQIYPLGGRRGTTIPLTVHGANLPAATWELAAPENADALFETRWTSAAGSSNPIVVATDDLPEVLEVEPNDQPEQLKTVTAPVVVNGIIQGPGDVDGWQLDARKDQELVCETQAARLGSPVDTVLVLFDPMGKEVARADDGPNNSPDAVLRYRVSADGLYRLQVSERFASRGGPAFAYRIRIASPRPTVRLELTADVLNVDRGAQQKLPVQVLRDGGHNAPVTLALKGLPAGVTAGEVTVAPNQNRGELVVQATKEARIDAARIEVVGRTELNGAMYECVAEMPRRPFEPKLEQILLAVTLPTPFKFQGTYEMTYIACGAVSRKSYTIERTGYDGPLEVRLADRQTRHLQGVTGPVITVPAGAGEFTYPISLPPWMELGRTSRVVLMATGEVDDGQGGRHKVCFTSGDQNNQMVNLVSPSPLRVTLDRTSLTVLPNGRAEVAVQLRRDRSLTGPVKIELIVPRHIRDVRAAEVEIPAGQDGGKVNLDFGAAPGPFNMPVTIRATMRRGDDPLVAEAQLDLVSSR